MQSGSVIEGRAIGWVAAALAAGPVYTLIVLGPAPLRANALMPVGLILILPLAVCFGLVLAAAPIGMMIVIGGWLGARWAIGRRPIVWWAVAGALAAAVARRYVRWRDPVVL